VTLCSGALDDLRSKLGSHVDMEKGVNGRIGVTGRAVRSRESQLVEDATQDPDFYQAHSGETLSELAVPIKIGNKVIGVVNVEHADPGAFDQDDRKALEALASQTAIAIENARRFEDLRKLKGYIGSKTAVDWIKMVSTAWGHSVRREVGTALGYVALLRGLLARGNSIQEAEKELDQLESVVKGIKEIPITAPLSYEDAVDSVQVNDLLKAYLERQWTHVRYRPVELCPDFQENLDSIATVRVSRQWLRRAVELVVDNSVQAMSDSPEKRLSVTTRLAGETVEISVEDTGPGIPEGVLEKLFDEPIDKPIGSRGAGIGLILAQTIIQTYGGDICVESTGDEGTTMVIALPVEK
jgi:two-component system sensor histidine kinase/response regulator